MDDLAGLSIHKMHLKYPAAIVDVEQTARRWEKPAAGRSATALHIRSAQIDLQDDLCNKVLPADPCIGSRCKMHQ